MRRGITLFTLITLITLLFLVALAHAGTGCDAVGLRGPAGLPATVLVKGVCGTFALRRDGTVVAAHPPAWAPPWAKGALARADHRTYIVHRGGHLGLLRNGRVLWRSRFAHGSDNVVLHNDAIAFSVYRLSRPALWVARVGAPERLVGREEELHGWARAGGFFTQSGPELRLRAPDGRLARRLADIKTSTYDRTSESLFAVSTSGFLIRTDGRRTARLANLVPLRLAEDPALEVLAGGLIRISSRNRTILFLRDGTRFASVSLSRSAMIVSALGTLPARRGVVFVVNYPRSLRRGTDRVLLVERGRRVPRVLYERPTDPRTCGDWASLSVIGKSALYWRGSNHALVALDTSGRRPPIDLRPALRRIPGFRHHGRLLRAEWAAAWNS
jgi:hypothetical protein